ncbi:MAG: hypothetical protein HUN04_06180 [Desulfobacter sp.]|nr:MAG: hypothetical protein HUN04_06180 [Desulfobacter sp.]
MGDTIFYSWQSDLPNHTNRGLIQSALEKATKDIKLDESIAIEPVVDRDTLGEPGSPDIAATIFRKIESAKIFVGDVSCVNKSQNGRLFPNPNVLIELGYALKSISSERIILVFNTEYGDVSELPFDLRFKRVLTYNMGQDDEPGPIRKILRKNLKNALKAIFEYLEENSEDKEKIEYLSHLNMVLTKIILYGEESRQRDINPWAQEVIDSYEDGIGEVRELIAKELALNIEVADDLEILITQLNEVVDFPKGIGRESWENFNKLVDNAVATAWKIKKAHIDAIPIREESKLKISKIIAQKQRVLNQEITRYEKSNGSMKYKIFDDIRSTVSDFGYIVLQISYYNFNGIKTGLSEALREIAKPLHTIELRYEMKGNDSEEDFIEEVKNSILKIESLLKGIVM